MNKDLELIRTPVIFENSSPDSIFDASSVINPAENRKLNLERNNYEIIKSKTRSSAKKLAEKTTL